MNARSRKNIDCSNPAPTAENGAPCPIDWVYHNVMEYLDVGIIVLDSDRRQVVYQNASTRELLQGEIDPGDYREVCALLLATGEVYADGQRFEGPRTLRSGNRLLGYSVYTINEQCCCIFIRDITEKARLMSIAEAVNTMDNIGYIFAGIRHEIGNPINSIKMTMSVLRRNLERFSPEQVQEYVDRTLTEISRVEYLLKSLKNFSMFENLAARDLDLAEFLGKFAFLVSSDLEKDGIHLVCDPPAAPVWGRTDPRALQQVLLNLLTNATGALEGRPEPRIEISLGRGDGLVWVRVRDNGCGISAEEQKHLFKPFYTTKSEGTGLGLVITRKMLAQLDSSIEIHSEPGVGTTAAISIPTGKPGHD